MFTKQLQNSTVLSDSRGSGVAVSACDRTGISDASAMAGIKDLCLSHKNNVKGKTKFQMA